MVMLTIAGGMAAALFALMPDLEAVSEDQLANVHGGMIPKMWTAMEQAVSMGLNVHWIDTGPHYPHSRHWRGRAFDVGGSQANMRRFFNWAKHTHPHELIFRHEFIRDGRHVRPIGGHMTHVHYSV